MATRSAIWLKECEDFYIGIYCHFDGYLEFNGKILYEHYKDYNKVKSLINLGNISQLGKELTPKARHTFDSPEEDVTVAYHRDRGEPLKQYKEFSLSGIIMHDEEYNYLFQDSEWFLIGKSLIKLSDVLN